MRAKVLKFPPQPPQDPNRPKPEGKVIPAAMEDWALNAILENEPGSFRKTPPSPPTPDDDESEYPHSHGLPPGSRKD